MSEIKVRTATIDDTDEIVEIIKVALGKSDERSSKKWIWKHFENPFGESQILVATDGPKIVGVRAFMTWSWYNKSLNKTYKALRAVDTAVLPSHRRKGIFSNLTTLSLEKAKTNGHDFVFNTPNGKSMPGYLKLGWVFNRKIPVNFFINPFSFFYTQKRLVKLSEEAKQIIKKKNLTFTSSLNQFNITTPFTSKFLHWRYINNPMINYSYLLLDEKVLLIYYIKERGKTKECRIADVQILGENNDVQPKTKKILKKGIKILVKRHFFVSITPNVISDKFLFSFPLLFYKFSLKGPNMTTKQININNDEFSSLHNVSSLDWGYCLGDMELF